MSAQVVPSGKGWAVSAPLRDWHAAGRFLHFSGGDGAPVTLACGSKGEAERVAHYVNTRGQTLIFVERGRYVD